MNKPTLIEAARAALDALGNLIDAQNGPPLIDQADEWDCAMHEAHAAIDALRAALAAVETAKPAAWVLTEELDTRRTTVSAHLWFSDPKNDAWTPIWTHPPEPARQPMTAGEFLRLMLSLSSTTKHRAGATAFWLELARAVEAFHRIGSEGATR